MSETPELDNSEEVRQLLSSDLQSKRDEGVGKALLNLTVGIVNTRHVVSTLRQPLGIMADNVNNLTKIIKEANESSEKLTLALNRITFWGVIIAGSGVFVAFLQYLK